MNLKDTVTTLALAEGLDGHAAAVDASEEAVSTKLRNLGPVLRYAKQMRRIFILILI